MTIGTNKTVHRLVTTMALRPLRAGARRDVVSERRGPDPSWPASACETLLGFELILRDFSSARYEGYISGVDL
jgi:hypothetical protein